jgi:LSD1 subclass zinc finger protein
MPEAHRELRRIQVADERARRRAQQLFSELDSPPFFATRVLAAILDQPMFLFWLFFGVPVGLLSIFAGLAVDARFHPSAVVTTGVIFAVMFVFVFVPRALGIYANRRASGRRILLAGLRSRPPKLPDGPARCRECGAPLEVPPGATVARCAYCRADSAVTLKTPFLERAGKVARTVVRTVDEAAALDRKERSAIRRALLRELLRYLLLISTFGALFATYMWDDERVRLRDDGSAPGLGIAALVVGTILLIAVMIRSAAGSSEREAEETRQRREGTGVPRWVRTLGPIGVLVLLWMIRAVNW